MSKFIEKKAALDGDRLSAWPLVRDTVSAVLFEAQASCSDNGQRARPAGDLRVRIHYDATYLRDEVIVTWDEVA